VINPEEQIEHWGVEELRRKFLDQAEELAQLRETQAKLMARVRQFISGFPFGLIVLTMDQRIKAINKVATEFFQYPEGAVARRPISTLFPTADRFDPAIPSLRLIARKQGGESFATEVFVNALEIGGEELLFISVQDVNERHRLEQLRSDLMAMVSHDLRAPLASLRITLEMVCEGTYGDLSDRGKGLVSQGVTSVEYLNSLVEGLLESEKAETGSIELKYRETSISAVVSKAISALPVHEGSGSAVVETEITNDAIKVDEGRIVQVLINLLANALKFSPSGSRVLVKAGIEGLGAKFQVIDSGPGIPSEMRTVVFERYRQLDHPSGTKRRGFGLGLAICKALVEKHRGRIWVEEGDNGGSAFCFSVPMVP
jgi:signal transduction histidine kinase